jgi:hypothetical protein
MSRTGRPALALALILVCAAALAACGGSSPSSSSSTSAAGGSSASAGGAGAGGGNAAGFAKFRDCLKSQGVTIPPRGQGAGGGGGYGPPAGGQPQLSAAQQKAMQACAKYRPQGAGQGGGFRQNAAAFKPYLTCLKAQGLNVDINAGFNALRGISRTDPKLQPALRACASKLPQRPGGGSATPGSTTTT